MLAMPLVDTKQPASAEPDAAARELSLIYPVLQQRLGYSKPLIRPAHATSQMSGCSVTHSLPFRQLWQPLRRAPHSWQPRCWAGWCSQNWWAALRHSAATSCCRWVTRTACFGCLQGLSSGKHASRCRARAANQPCSTPDLRCTRLPDSHGMQPKQQKVPGPASPKRRCMRCRSPALLQRLPAEPCRPRCSTQAQSSGARHPCSQLLCSQPGKAPGRACQGCCLAARQPGGLHAQGGRQQAAGKGSHDSRQADGARTLAPSARPVCRAGRSTCWAWLRRCTGGQKPLYSFPGPLLAHLRMAAATLRSCSPSASHRCTYCCLCP